MNPHPSPMKRVIFFLLAALSFGYYLWIGLNNDFGLSLLPFWLLLALLFLVLGLVGTPPLPRALRRWLRAGLAVLLVLFLTVEGFILGGMTKRSEDGLDCLIVPGAALQGDGPSVSLEGRLEAALDYLERNPETAVIVSGGQGVSEVMSEARCMANWLVERGVDPDRIRLEEQSTDTAENLRYSLALLEPDEVRVGVVTSNFHVFRAVGIARRLAGDDLELSGLPADFPPRLLPHYLVREFCSVCVDTLRGNLRWL